MKQIITVFLIFLGVSPLFIVKAQDVPASSKPWQRWTLLEDRSDDFEGDVVDYSKWVENPNHFGVWSWDNDNVWVSGGTAKIKVEQETHTRTFWDGCNQKQIRDFELYYKSGILKSVATGTYGYYEASIKAADMFPGVCPAFWLFSDIDRTITEPFATQYSEIDVVELLQGDYDHGFYENPKGMEHNLHCIVNDASGNPKWRRPKAFPEENQNVYEAPFDPREDFHKYGVDVGEDSIVWYVDGVEVGRKANLYWHREMNVTLSMGMRRQFVSFQCNQHYPNADFVTKEGFPTIMEIEYVKVWKKEPVLGIEDSHPPVSKVVAYPNPTRDYLNIKGLESKPVTLVLYNLQGVKLYEENISGKEQYTISVKEFPAGLHYLSIFTDGENQVIKFHKE